ncbi:MAG TPA: response regulator, partial [Methanomassiliicoccales archaeon]|nr:response regulator [Methanomassiliicoccales archaeon]
MIRVAYIDDEPVLLDVVKEFLEMDQGVLVETFESPKNALEVLKARHYDAIISDLQMPDMDGLEFLHRVRTGGDQIPFIIFTGKGREEVAMEALNRGANFYLQKGPDTRVVCRELSNALNQLVHMARAEKSSRINEQKYMDIMENSNSLIMLTDMKGTITFINRYARRFFGFSDELMGRSVIGTILPAEGRSKLDLVRMRHGWLNDPDRFNSVVVRNQKSNGSPVWIAWSSKAVRDKDGRIVGMKSIGNDISTQMADENEMEQCQRIMRMTVDSMPVPMLAVGWKGEIITCNRHFMRLWGITSDVKVGEESVDLLPRIYALLNDPRGFENDILNAASREGPDRPARFNLKDGRELTFIPMPPQDQTPVAMLWSVGPERGLRVA